MQNKPDLKVRHSSYNQQLSNESIHIQKSCKSENQLWSESSEFAPSGVSFSSCGEYLKKYDETNSAGDSHKTQVIVTDSALERLEKTVNQGDPKDGLARQKSHVKFFQNTIQDILQRYYLHMNDFENYKAKFYEILSKNNEDSLAEMEVFVKNLIQQIISTEMLLSKESRSWTGGASEKTDLGSKLSSKLGTNESYINSNFESSTSSNKFSNSTENEIRQNLNSTRKLFSETNVGSSNVPCSGQTMSVDDLLKSAKNLLDQSFESSDCDLDKEIPIKPSTPKKNLHLNEDFRIRIHERSQTKSIVSKLCSYLCKKFRN